MPLTPGEARGYLARFLFRGDDVFKEVRPLSGGERSRLELALLGIMPSNLLLLDEPTNHLDIAAREAIEAFLAESPATLLVVSHDRRLLETICERLWVVDDGMAVPFDGGYRAWRQAVADGWTVEAEAKRRRRTGSGPGTAVPRARAPGAARRSSTPTPAGKGAGTGRSRAPAQGATAARALRARRTAPQRRGRTKLSKDAYRRRREAARHRAGAPRPSQDPAGARHGRRRRSRPTSSRCAASRASSPT